MIRVMIVEDDPMVLAINKKFLSKVEGFKVIGETDNLKEAEAKIRLYKPELVLLDVFFPTGRGIDLLKRLRADDILVDVIMITADKSTDTVGEAFRYGVVDYLIKPFKFSRFEDALKRYRQMKIKLGQTGQVDQESIDEWTYREGGPVEGEDPFDMDEAYKNPTYTKIYEYIEQRAQESFTASSIAAELGLSRITARRYLDYLEKNNVLLMDLEYGTVGRPKNIYKLNPDRGI